MTCEVCAQPCSETVRALPAAKRGEVDGTPGAIKYDPFRKGWANYGVGLIARGLLDRAPDLREVLLCVGGSASTDGGTGMLSGLGARFLDVGGARLVGDAELLEDAAFLLGHQTIKNAIALGLERREDAVARPRRRSGRRARPGAPDLQRFLGDQAVLAVERVHAHPVLAHPDAA